MLIHGEQGIEESGSVDVELKRECKVVYLMWFELGDDFNYVRKNCKLIVGTRHPTDIQQVLLKIDCDAQTGITTYDGDERPARLWHVTANYGPWNPAERGDPAQASDPLAMPPRWRLEWENTPEPAWEDVNGNPILNTAGDPFDPPVERDNLIAILTVRRNEASPDFPALVAMAGSNNVAAWNGFDAITVRLAPVSIPEIEYSQETKTYYYPMVYVFAINSKNWRKKPINTGFRQQKSKLKNVSNIQVILDDVGQPIQTPALLDQSGGYLKPPVAKGAIVIGSFDVDKSTDFSALKLDNLFTPPPVLS